MNYSLKILQFVKKLNEGKTWKQYTFSTLPFLSPILYFYNFALVASQAKTMHDAEESYCYTLPCTEKKVNRLFLSLSTSSCAFPHWGVKRYQIAQGRKIKNDVIFLDCCGQFSELWLGRSGAYLNAVQLLWSDVRVYLLPASSLSSPQCLLSPFDHGKLISPSHTNSLSTLRGYIPPVCHYVREVGVWVCETCAGQ